MKAKKLTPAERKWLDDLESLFLACPSKRLGCYTTGDSSLNFYDKTVEKSWREANGDPSLDAAHLHSLAGSELASIQTFIQIDSCSG